MMHLRIIPDSKLTNEKVETFAQTLCRYTSPLERREGVKVRRHPFFAYETILTHSDAVFAVSVPRTEETITRKAIESTWPRATIEEMADPFDETPRMCAGLSLHYHFVFAIRVDRRENRLLPTLLETMRALENDEKVYVQTLCVPAAKDWYVPATEAYERFKAGDMPQRYRLDKKHAAETAARLTANATVGMMNAVSTLIAGKSAHTIDLSHEQRGHILKDGALRPETLQKTRGDAYDVTVRIGVVASTNERAATILRMITTSYRELDGDNQFVPHDLPVAKTWEKMRNRKETFKLQRDFISIPEAARLFLLPPKSMQEDFKVTRIGGPETQLHSSLTTGGMSFGNQTYKGQTQMVYMPVKNHDVLCLPRVIVGGMGTGKTKGFGANWVVQAVRNGFGAVAIDPAKGEIGREVRRALHDDEIIHINLAERNIALDFCEVAYSARAKNRLANILLSFFEADGDETGGQTRRYLRAAVMAMQTGRISEVIRILEDAKYRASCIKKMRDGMHKTTLQQFNRESDARKNQIAAPIYNRLDLILGDEYLADCLESDDSLDMVELSRQRKAIIIDVPKKDLGKEAVDLIVNLLSFKLDLAMTLRPEEEQFPFFIVVDEPHQFLRSANVWESAAVESRKWRFGYVWMFHSWEQIPRHLSEIIKAAGVHYHLYASSKKTYMDLREEIAPITVEEAMKLKPYHAINVIRSDTDILSPFVARMAPPPSLQKNGIHV